MTNPVMPGLVKIGVSSKEPGRNLVEELSAETNTLSRFKVAGCGGLSAAFESPWHAWGGPALGCRRGGALGD